MDNLKFGAGLLDNRFLSRSIGYLEPSPALVVEPNYLLVDVIGLFKASPAGCVVVAERDGTVQGIFSERDVVLKVILDGVDIYKEPVSRCMTPNPETATMTTTIAFILTMMSRGGFRHVPIVDDKRAPVGLVSVKDIVDYIVREIDKEVDRFAGLGTTLHQVS